MYEPEPSMHTSPEAPVSQKAAMQPGLVLSSIRSGGGRSFIEAGRPSSKGGGSSMNSWSKSTGSSSSPLGSQKRVGSSWQRIPCEPSCQRAHSHPWSSNQVSSGSSVPKGPSGGTSSNSRHVPSGLSVEGPSVSSARLEVGAKD